MPSGADLNAEAIAAAIAAMKKAADSLSETAATARSAAPESVPSTEHSSRDADEGALQRYHHDLRQRGQLVDVDDTTDLSRLPPEVTHVRLPDGRVRRVGYS
jgi:hypothetical protein